MARFTLVGVNDLIRKLRTLEQGRELRSVIRKALRKAARPVLVTARQLAPFGEGALRRSLRIRSAKRSRRGIGVVVRPGTRSELGIPSTAKGYYPAHIEVGTQHIEETRYLRDAMELERAGAIETLSEDIGKGIEKIARAA